MLRKLIEQSKVSSIMFSNQTNNSLPKLFDSIVNNRNQENEYFIHVFRTGPNGTIPYSAPEVANASSFSLSLVTTKADVWSWGALLYLITYLKPPNYNPPCYYPPAGKRQSRDPQLLSVLRHSLVIDPSNRADVPWLAKHPYTRAS